MNTNSSIAHRAAVRRRTKQLPTQVTKEMNLEKYDSFVDVIANSLRNAGSQESQNPDAKIMAVMFDNGNHGSLQIFGEHFQISINVVSLKGKGARS